MDLDRVAHWLDCLDYSLDREAEGGSAVRFFVNIPASVVGSRGERLGWSVLLEHC